MRYVRCALVGAASALLTAIIWTIGCLFGPLVFAMMTLSAGLASSSVGTRSTAAAGAAGFAAGFYWQLRRTRGPIGA
jgi:hypothetical protein